MTAEFYRDTYTGMPRDDYDHLGRMVTFHDWRNKYFALDESEGFSHDGSFESVLRGLAWSVKKTDAMDRIDMDHIFRIVNKHFVVVPFWRDYYGELSWTDDGISDNDEKADGLIYFPVSNLESEGITRQIASDNLRSELLEHSAWATGDVWTYILRDENGEEIDSLCGLVTWEYAVESAKESAKSQRFKPVGNAE